MPTKKTKPTKKPRAKKSSTKQLATKVASSQKENVITKWFRVTFANNPAGGLLVILAALLALGFVVWLGYSFYERWQFSQADKKLSSLTTQLRDAIDPSAEIVKEKSCSYVSKDYSDIIEVPTCSVNYGFTTSSSEIITIINKIDNLDTFFSESLLEKYNENQSNKYINNFISIKTKQGVVDPLNCSLSINLSKVKSENKVGIFISCYDESVYQYYPIQ